MLCSLKLEFGLALPYSLLYMLRVNFFLSLSGVPFWLKMHKEVKRCLNVWQFGVKENSIWFVRIEHKSAVTELNLALSLQPVYRSRNQMAKVEVGFLFAVDAVNLSSDQ